MGLKKDFLAKWSPAQQAAYWLVIELKWCEAEHELVGAAPEDVERVHDAYAKLAGIYRPHRQLPPPGQGLWRKLCHLWDTSEEKNYELSCSLDEFCEWLVAFYKIGSGPDDPSAEATEEKLHLKRLNRTQREILEAVGTEPLFGHEIAKRAGYEEDNVRKVLSLLVKLGLVKKHDSGQGYYR